jgi:hypothetical protein
MRDVARAIVVAVLVAGCASPARITAVGSANEPGANPTAARTGALSDGALMSCAEEYSPAAVAHRAFAFDGIVIDVGAAVSDRGDESDLGLPGVTFQVREWFSGGSGRTVTVDLQAPDDEQDGPTEPGVYGIGARLLVSGEPRWAGPPLANAIAWSCGFTRYYDPTTARSWNEALCPTHVSRRDLRATSGPRTPRRKRTFVERPPATACRSDR